MRVTLIHNPKAGDDRLPTAGQLVALIKEAGHRVRLQSTDEEGWQKALKKRADLVVVAGGDGAVGKVARRMIGRGVPIAILPMGTANNISRTLGIADMAITHLILTWKSSRRLKFDAGLARGPWGERHFVEGFGTGLLSSAIPKAQKSKTLGQLNEADAKVSYAQQIFREHVDDAPALHVKAILDGVDISGRFVAFEVLNMQYVGPNLFLAPHAMRSNGEFEVVRVAARQRATLQAYIKNWQAGVMRPLPFKALRGKRLEIVWSGFHVHMDDKIWPGPHDKKKRAPAPIVLTVEPAAVEFLVPAEIHAAQELARKNGEKGRKEAARKKAMSGRRRTRPGQ